MIRWCASITIWRWSGRHSSFWWTARWTTAARTCSTLSAPTVNGSLRASPIPGGRIVGASNSEEIAKIARIAKIAEIENLAAALSRTALFLRCLGSSAFQRFWFFLISVYQRSSAVKVLVLAFQFRRFWQFWQFWQSLLISVHPRSSAVKSFGFGFSILAILAISSDHCFDGGYFLNISDTALFACSSNLF